MIVYSTMRPEFYLCIFFLEIFVVNNILHEQVTLCPAEYSGLKRCCLSFSDTEYITVWKKQLKWHEETLMKRLLAEIWDPAKEMEAHRGLQEQEAVTTLSLKGPGKEWCSWRPGIPETMKESTNRSCSCIWIQPLSRSQQSWKEERRIGNLSSCPLILCWGLPLEEPVGSHRAGDWMTSLLPGYNTGQRRSKDK